MHPPDLMEPAAGIMVTTEGSGLGASPSGAAGAGTSGTHHTLHPFSQGDSHVAPGAGGRDARTGLAIYVSGHPSSVSVGVSVPLCLLLRY